MFLNEQIHIDLSPKYAQINPSKNFLSEPMLHYILKNASAKPYFKLIQTSKYFLLNEPPKISHFDNIDIKNGFAVDSAFKGNIIPELAGNKVWVYTKLLSTYDGSNVLSNFLLRVYRCNIETLVIDHQILTYDELKLLMGEGNVTTLGVNCNTITHSNGDPVVLEDMLLMTPNLTRLFYITIKPFTFNSQKVAALPNFDKLVVKLEYILDEFDIEAFRAFLKKIQSPSCSLTFHLNASRTYRLDLQKAVEVDYEVTTGWSHLPEMNIMGVRKI